MEESKNTLGDRLKIQEQVEASRRADPKKPLMCRLDGKAFHTFTKGLKRPYDTRLNDLMVDTTKFLVKSTNAKLGYTQSDEITLCWWNEDGSDVSQYMFDGKFQKLTSVLASLAGSFFSKELAARIPEKADAIPCFDARVWNVEDKHEVYLNFLWRQDDAIKNSISMAAQALFSHVALHGVSSERKKEMLREVSRPWEDEPLFFKMGSFVKRVVRNVELTGDQLAKIPEQHRHIGPVPRSFVEDIGLGYIKNDETAKAIFN